VPEPSASEDELPIEKLKWHKLPGSDQIQAELIKARGRTIHYEILNLLFLLGISRNCPSTEGVDQCTYLLEGLYNRL
jgi:hypothetical protein